MARDVEAGRAFVRVSIKENLAGLRRISSKLKTWGASMAGMGTKMAGVGAAMSLPFVSAVKTLADFDDAMLSLAGITGATQAQLKAMTTTAQDLGASTSFTAIEVGELMNVLGRAGFNPQQINAMTGAVLNLSRATGTEASTSAGIMSAAIRAFKLDAEDAARVADVFAMTANKSFNSVEQLGDAMVYAGPVASQMGMSLEDTLAILGGLGNVGIQASQAGTALRRLAVMSGADAQKLGKIFGVSFADAEGNAKPLVDALGEVFAATANLGTAERAAKFKEAFGLLGITSAGVIAESTADIKGLREELDKTGNYSADLAKRMDSGLGGAMRILNSAIEGVKLALGEALAPVLSTIGNMLTTVAGKVRAFVQENQGVVYAVAGVVAALVGVGVTLLAIGGTMWAVGAAIGVIVTIISGIGAAFTMVAAVISGAVGLILSPIGLVVAAVAGLTAAFVAFTDTGATVAASMASDFGSAFQALKDMIGGIVNALKVGDIALAGEIAMAGLKLAFFEATDTMRQKWLEFNQAIVEGFVTAASTVINVWRKASQKLAEWFADLGYKVALMMSGQKDYLTDEERQAARDSSLNIYYDQLQGNMQSKVNELGEITTENLDADIKAGQDRIRALRAQLDTLTKKADAAAGGGLSPEQLMQLGLAGSMLGMAGLPGGGDITGADQKKTLMDAIQAGGTIAAMTGTFSSIAASVGFAGLRTDDPQKETAENTKKAADSLKRIERQQQESEAAFT